jgi:hypothetical protein
MKKAPMSADLHCAETVGFEVYFRHHLGRHSLDFGEISATEWWGNHVEPVPNSAFVGKQWANITEVGGVLGDDSLAPLLKSRKRARLFGRARAM